MEGSGPRVLVVEDEALVAMMVEDILSDLGCRIAASFGAVSEALDWLQAQATPPDGALLDVNIGGELVFPVADMLKAAGVPFAFATGYTALPTARFPEAPVLAKPLSPDKLGQVVERFGR